jgi:hypothetical protein
MRDSGQTLTSEVEQVPAVGDSVNMEDPIASMTKKYKVKEVIWRLIATDVPNTAEPLNQAQVLLEF